MADDNKCAMKPQNNNTQITCNSQQYTYLFNQASNLFRCMDCPRGCKYCNLTTVSDLTSLKCHTCMSGFQLNGGMCYSQCDILTQYFDAASKSCQVCDASCKGCTSKTACIECATNYKMVNGKCEKVSVPVQDCGTGYYDYTLQICRCFASDEFYNSTLNECNKIVVTCPATMYLQPQTNSCQYCTAENCLICNPKSPSQCLSCASNYYLVPSRKTCAPCQIAGCEVCKTATTCAACKPGFYQYKA